MEYSRRAEDDEANKNLLLDDSDLSHHQRRRGSDDDDRAMDRSWPAFEKHYPGGFVSRYMRRITRKHCFIILALFIAVTLLVANPYLPSYPPSQWSQSDSQKALDEGAPPPPPESKFCSVWPVDAEGGYVLKQQEPRSPDQRKQQKKLELDSLAPEGGWRKPEGVKVVGMIFYGRPRTVDILDCYLRQNLVSNGGYLDEVWFMVHTQIEEDVAWLRHLTDQEDEYIFQDLKECTNAGYGCIWEWATEDDTIYIKIDDDMIYIHPDAIPQLIHTRIAEPHPYAVSAQIVNSPVMGIEAYHYGAVYPFLPDPTPQAYLPGHEASTHDNSAADPSLFRRQRRESWRVSELPLYPAGAGPMGTTPLNVVAPYQGHPWLLLTTDPRDTGKMMKTPFFDWDDHRGPDPIAFGPGLMSWGVAAQQLYSLLYNIEKNRISRYFFGRRLNFWTEDEEEEMVSQKQKQKTITVGNAPRNNTRAATTADPTSTSTSPYDGPGGEALFDMQFLRYNLNFVAIWGKDIREGLPIDDDELELTALIPQRLNRPFVIDTRSIVAHHYFRVQKEGIGATDLLDRWRAFINENVCEANNRKVPMDPPCQEL